MRIIDGTVAFEREKLATPFGFKGGSLHELWQTVVRLDDASGNRGVGLGTQSVLWSDARVFAENSESRGNEMMLAVTVFAEERAREISWDDPIDLLAALLPATYEYARTVTANPGLRLTFVLNALVALDNAAWILYSKARGFGSFDEMIPPEFGPALSARHRSLAAIPLVSYGVSLAEIQGELDRGCCLLKIKIGSDPEGDGDLDRMLAWDQERLSQVHEIARKYESRQTESGRILYYLDANGRYDSKDRLMRLLDHAGKIGALERIAMVEEPFPEDAQIDVSDIPVCVAADESVHSVRNASERIDQGYGAIALKPIAKTLSMSLQVARLCHDRQIPCFCADLTVNPILVDWNKNVAARLGSFPGLKGGLIETNGHQNYARWPQMQTYHPCQSSSWTAIRDGQYFLDDDFFVRSGGIFLESPHYSRLVTASRRP